jgi:undecaprenyl-diphosphatase
VTHPLGLFDAVILGIVEGVTEYLPVSSTGHLVLAKSLLGLDSASDVERSVNALLIVIQGGAILAVLGLYRKAVGRMILGVLGKDPGGLLLFRNILIAFLPAAVLGPFLDDWIEARLFRPIPVLLALGVGGIVMILADRRLRDRGDRISNATDRTGADLSARAAFQIGLLQCVAMWPGTSRSMVTILGGMFVGLRPARAAEFSFLLGLPTLGGATVFKLAKNMSGEGPDMFAVLGWAPVLLGLAVATLSAALAVRWLVSWLTRHGLAAFGWYRIGLTAVLVPLVIAGVVSIGPEVQDDQSAEAATAPEMIAPSDPTTIVRR